MSSLDLEVVPLFATPFGLASVPEAAALNPSVATLLSRRATPEHADSTNRQPRVYCSRPDLLDWQDDSLRRITQGIVARVIAVIRSLNDMPEDTFASLKVQMRAWFNIVRPDGRLPPRNYPNAAWCAVYCVAAPEPSPQRFDSGVLRLLETRPAMFPDATNSVTRMPFLPGHSTWRPQAGQVAVFPASLMHEIALLRADQDLLLITVLLRFHSPQQTGMPW